MRYQTKYYPPPVYQETSTHYAIIQMESMGILHPEANMFFNQLITRNDPDVVGAIMTQLSLKTGLNR